MKATKSHPERKNSFRAREHAQAKHDRNYARPKQTIVTEGVGLNAKVYHVRKEKANG